MPALRIVGSGYLVHIPFPMNTFRWCEQVFGVHNSISSLILGGALVVTVAVTALAEDGRIARFANLVFAAWLIDAPWLLTGGTATSKWSGISVGVLLIVATVPRGPINERYGAYDRFIR